MDWHWLEKRMEQDEALDKLEAAVEEWEQARDEYYRLVYWAEYSQIHRN